MIPAGRTLVIAAASVVLSHGLLTRSAPAGGPMALFAFNRGLQNAQKGDFDAAIDEYTRAITINPGYADAYNNRGFAWAQKGDCEKAIDDYDRAIELNRRHLFAYTNRSSCRNELGDVEGAIADLDVTIRLDSMYAAAYFHRANLRYASSDVRGAITDYRQAIDIEPEFAPAHMRLGVVRSDQGAYLAALAHFVKATNLEPRFEEAWLHRAAARRDMGDRKGAIRDFTRLLELNPRHPVACAERGRLAYDAGDMLAALEDLRKACALNPKDQDDERLYIWLARAAQGEREAASSELAAYLDTRFAEADQTWYPELAALLVGRVDEAALLAAASAEADESARRERLCEARFYAGALKLLDGDRRGAAESFRRCLETRLRDVIAFDSAEAALARLDRVREFAITTGAER